MVGADTDSFASAFSSRSQHKGLLNSFLADLAKHKLVEGWRPSCRDQGIDGRSWCLSRILPNYPELHTDNRALMDLEFGLRRKNKNMRTLDSTAVFHLVSCDQSQNECGYKQKSRKSSYGIIDRFEKIPFNSPISAVVGILCGTIGLALYLNQR